MLFVLVMQVYSNKGVYLCNAILVTELHCVPKEHPRHFWL